MEVRIDKQEQVTLFGEIIRQLSETDTQVTHDHPNNSFYCVRTGSGVYFEVWCDQYNRYPKAIIHGDKYTCYNDALAARLRTACDKAIKRTEKANSQNAFNDALNYLGGRKR